MEYSRRRFLASSTVTGIAGLAGCSSTGSNKSDTPTETSTTPTDTDTEPENTETETQQTRDVVAEIVRVFDYPENRKEDRKVEIKVTNRSKERLLAAWVSYMEGGLVFDVPAGGSRKTTVYDPWLKPGGETQKGDRVKLPDKWVWFPEDYPRTFVEADTEAGPAIPVDGYWRFPVENPTDLSLDEVRDVSADGNHELGRSANLGGSVIDDQLMLYSTNLGGFWEYDWTVELTSTTGKESFPMAIQPPEMSIDGLDFSVQKTDQPDSPFKIQSIDVDLTAENEQPLFDAELRFYSTHDNLRGTLYCTDSGQVSKGWDAVNEENGYMAPSFLGRFSVSGRKTPVIESAGSNRVGKSKTVTFAKGENGTAKCLPPARDLISFDLPIDENERIGVQLVSGLSVIDYATSDPIANRL